MKSYALVVVASSTNPSRVILDSSIILLLLVVAVVVVLVLFLESGYAWPDRDMLVLIYWVNVAPCSEEKLKDGAPEGLGINFSRYFNKDIPMPLFCVDKVSDRERHVGFVVDCVLGKDNVPPGSIEVSACHGKKMGHKVWILAVIYTCFRDIPVDIP